MGFGKVLKKIRNEQGDSLRKLAGKTGIFFTKISKIENGEILINEDTLKKFITEYPLHRKILIEAYANEMLPDFVLQEIKNS